MLFRRGKNKSPDTDKELEALKREVESLRNQNAALQQSLNAVGTVAGEYLYKWRSVALPLLGAEWELRYFVLQDTSIRYYTTSRDVAFSPREEFSLLGSTVEWQGQLSNRLWVWALLDDSGSVQLRVGSASEQTALKWLYALQDAGCHVCVAQTDLTRHKSMPTPRRGFSASGALNNLTDRQATYSPATTPTTPIDLPPRPTSFAPRTDADTQHTSAPHTPRTHTTQYQQPSQLYSPTQVSGLQQHNVATAGGQKQGGVPVSAHVAGASPAAGGGGGGAPARKSQEGVTAGPAHRGAMLPSSPVHNATRVSYLSSERMWHEKHTGMINLMAVILVATNFRLVLENALKYGWRYNPVKALQDLTIGNTNVPVALCYPFLMGLAGLSLLCESIGYKLLEGEMRLSDGLAKKDAAGDKITLRRLRALRSRNEWLLFVINFVLTSASIAVPWAVIHITDAEALPGGVLICLAVVWWMKLVSFHHCCFDLRNARRDGDVRPGERGSPSSQSEWATLAYPEDLTVSHFSYFLVAPTLTYQVNYPRSGPIRWKWLARRVGELLVAVTVFTIIIKQYMEPTIANSMGPLRQMNWVRLSERLLKLALPNTYCWLVMFYMLFHLWLNILAELVSFGDREFYKDWWNAPTLGEYWRLWNMPVHKWLLRHVYFPAINARWSRTTAMILVFFVSAVFHELICGVPLHTVRLWAFAGIMLQVPMIMFTEAMRKKLKRDEAGNYVFWLTFCVLGQPLSLLLYAHDYLYSSLHKTQAA